ncbi:Crp/Fnr family transcriptional regulator [Penaeicola halotolerans]|uniref:Crp/Fnr family transcriptional regulator n=1 Tax=Penaeicola halotolerans TaxID=2793196 RepID=UPI001CF913D8|nr:cyclic nucleotide-binding domain-containing protein [Penaeicola halotolerans]
MMNPFKKKYTDTELEMFAFLAGINFFERLTNAEMVKFLPLIHTRKYQKDEVVFFRNDPSQAIYIVKKGLITLNLDIKDEFETILHVGKGGCFGENSLLEGTKRVYTSLVISEEAELYVIPSDTIQEVFATNARIKAKMMTSLAEFYNKNYVRLFTAYKDSFGFFNLGEIYE